MNRLRELDQAKALALIFSIFLISAKLTLSGFKDWNPGNLSFSSLPDWLFIFESYTKMALIYFGAYLSFHANIDIQFISRHFIKLVLISSFIFIHGLEFVKIHWGIIQSLFFYYLIFYSLKKSSNPLILGTVLSFLSIGSIPFESELKNNFLGFFIFGDFSETNSFNINQGVFCAVLSYISLHFNFKKEYNILLSFFGLIATFSYFFFDNNNLKIPLLSTSFSGFLIGFLIINFFKQNYCSFLEKIGQNSFYSYLFSWLIIHWIIIWNNLFWNTETNLAFSLIITILFSSLIFLINKQGNIWKKIKSY